MVDGIPLPRDHGAGFGFNELEGAGEGAGAVRPVARYCTFGFVGPLSVSSFPTTTMNRLFKNKRKQSLEPPPQGTSPGVAIDTTAGPVSYQPPPSIGPEGGQTRSYQDLEADRPDLTVALDQGSSGSSRIEFQDSMGEDRELPTSVAWTSGVAIGGTESRNNRTSEHF